MASPSVHSTPSGSGTDYLYRAAIGPRAQDYYLDHFTRFDERGGIAVSWNWAACAGTLNWMIYRRMWGWALAYAAVLAALVGLAWGAGQLVPELAGTGVLLLLPLLTAAFVLPGLYGNAWYYLHCNRKILAVLRTVPQVTDAVAVLARRAPDDRTLRWLGAGNIVLLTLAIAVGYGFSFGGAAPQLAEQDNRLATVPSAADIPVSPASDPAAAAAGDTPSALVSLPAETAPPAAAGLSDTAAPPESPMVQAAPGGVAVSRPVARADAAQTQRQVWAIQVGAYAQEANARKVLAQVRALGLEADAEPLPTTQGRLMRVRVGPYRRQAEAEEAAQRIRHLDLPALVIRQRS